MRPLPVERWTAPIRLTGAIAALVVGLSAAPASASFSFGLPAAAGLPPELTQDLVAYYPFDETAGTVVKDQSGNGRDAAIVNTNATHHLEQRARPEPARRQRRHLARRAVARLAAGRPEQRDDRLRRPALERHHAGAGVRVRQDG